MGLHKPTAHSPVSQSSVILEVIAQAELAWPEKKLAVVIQRDDVNEFEQAGWRFWSIDNSPDEIATAIIQAF